MAATWYVKLVGVSWFLLVVIISECPVKGQTIDDMISRELDRAPDRRRSGVLLYPSRNSSEKIYLMQLDMILTAEQWKRIQAANTRNIHGTLSRQKRKGIKHRDRLWKEGKVPFKITRGVFDDEETILIYEAIDVWQTYTCVTFEEINKKRRSPGIRFRDASEAGCNSYVGQVYQNRVQDITLGRVCRTKPIIVHEIGHALGLYHEHMRPDREEYVNINMENVLEGQKYRFEKIDESIIDVETVPYDLVSIMHYGKLYMSKNKTANLYTMEPHNAEYLDKIGEAKSASFKDIKMVNHMYECAARCPSHITCPPDGFLGRNCRCFCPSNSDGTAVVDCSDRKNCSVPAVENGRMYYEGQNYRPLEEYALHGLRECPVKKGQTIDDIISSELDRDVTVAPNRRRSGPLSFPSSTSSREFYLMQLDMKLTAEQWKIIKAANEPQSNGTLSRQKRKGIRHRDMLWKGGKVPFEIIEKDFNASEQILIYQAIDVWQTYTCVTFVDIKNSEEGQMSSIRFIERLEGGCYSYVGQVSQNSAQDINLGPTCRTKPIIIHEIGHALGLFHEHMRPDREEYVKINMENVLEQHKKDFNTFDETSIDVETVPYDLFSIMHYGKLFMSKNKTANLYTIEPHDAKYLDVIGKAESASFTDIKMVNHMYKCAARCANITCPPDGFLGKGCRCFCPSNSDGTATVDCRDRNRCEPPDVNGPYLYVYTQGMGEEVHANESRIDEYTMIEVLCKSDMIDELGNITCINGTWTGYLPDCISENCSVPAVEKGRMDYEGQNYRPLQEYALHGYRVTVKCSQGYELIRGQSYLNTFQTTCQLGNFTHYPLASCVEARCDINPSDTLLVAVDDERSEGPKVEHGTRVLFSCRNGYEFTESTHRSISVSCSKGELNQPTCRPIVTCPPLPTLMYGERYQDTFTHERDTHGSVVENTCRSGFLLRGGFTQTCRGDGTWSGETAVCQEISCGIPDVGQGIMGSHDSIRLGDINFIYCFENATYSGDADTGLIRCTENGWTEGYCYANCILEEMDNGAILEARTINHDEELPWRCPENYVKPLEIRDVTCYNGTLTARPSCQHADCSDPPLISNAYHNGSDTIATYRDNDVIVYRCYGGYERRGYSRCVCQNGNWTRVEMVCNLLSCPDPRIDRLQLSYPRTAGSYVTASCSKGYRLVGPSRLMCTVDMEWHPSLPSCTVARNTGNNCRSPLSGDQAYPYRDTCYYLLRDNYSSTHIAMLACYWKYLAKLVTVRHQTSWRFLQRVKSHAGWGSKDVWLGLRWDDDTWKWNNGETVGRFSSTLWQEGEGRSRLPVKGKRCASMEGDANWRWNDEYCSSVFRPLSVICEGSRRSDV